MKTRSWIALFIAALLAMFIAFNWQGILLGISMATAEGRPKILADARWNDPASAHDFSARFHQGTLTIELVGWLRENKFDVDVHRQHAQRIIQSLPCNEMATVTWQENADGHLIQAQAKLSEAGCL